jgi:Xaa-Pro aminopeptidase
MPSPDVAILNEKAGQAVALLNETGLDAWLTFARETAHHPDPGVEMIVGTGLTWVSAFLLTARDERIAIVGRYDVSNVEAAGVFQDVIGYDQGIGSILRDVLARLDPRSIGLNHSTDDHTADGLTLGMYRLLCDLLDGTPYRARLTSAGPLLAKLRARKSETELQRIRAAIDQTEEIARQVGGTIRSGQSERDIAGAFHDAFRQRGLEPAWGWESCPLVNTGPLSEAGHASPREDLRVEPGHVVHVDLGVRAGGYCSDLQRIWYVRRPGEVQAPAEVQRAFDTVLQAIDAAAAVLKPGARGCEVDAEARRVVVEAGYPEYPHGTGHGLGRAVHDGGPLLGPLWEKYGTLPKIPVESGNVFTIELGVPTEAGHVGLEEDVLVTPDGCAFLSRPQRSLMLI